MVRMDTIEEQFLLGPREPDLPVRVDTVEAADPGPCLPDDGPGRVGRLVCLCLSKERQLLHRAPGVVSRAAAVLRWRPGPSPWWHARRARRRKSRPTTRRCGP